MRILFLTSEFPYPPDSGGKIKTLSILAYLWPRHQTDVLCFNRHGLNAEQQTWAAEHRIGAISLNRGRNVLNLASSYFSGRPLSIARNRSGAMREAVARAMTADHQVLFVDGWLMTQYLPSQFAGKTLLHEHNAEYVMWRRAAEVVRNPLLRLLARVEERRVRRYEESILKRFDTVFVVSAVDRQALIAIGADADRLLVLPNLPDPALLQRQSLSFEASTATILYFGTLTWQPNLEGLEHLLREVFPLVRQQLPEAHAVIAGKEAPGWLERLVRRTPGAELTRYVNDAEALYGSARVFVEATHSGGGTKLKVLNALARGLPVVASPEAIEGIDAVSGEHLMVGNDARELAGAVVRLMTDRDLWVRLSTSGRTLIRERYIAETAYRHLDEALSNVRAPA